MKKSKIEWNKVTLLSKAIALILFILLPFLGFYLGMQYQKALTESQSYSPQIVTQPIVDF